MISALDPWRVLSLESLLIRLVLAVLFGGLIGLERERKHRPAGFRTYMLVCLGSTLTMLLSQYMQDILMIEPWRQFADSFEIKSDVSRLGAQVINGIGFLGAGTIIVTDRQKVKGMTTAAGLWASACTGLAIGAGFYECVALAFLLITVSVRMLDGLGTAIVKISKNMKIYVEIQSVDIVGAIVGYVKTRNIQVCDIDIEHGSRGARPSTVFWLRLNQKQRHNELLAELSLLEGVVSIEEI